MIINRCWNCMEDMGNARICPKCGYDPRTEKTLTYALKPNTILHGKYLVGRVLGQGGFGITYIGFDLTLELKVAIKEYFPFTQASRNANKSYALSWQGMQSQNDAWRSGLSGFLEEARKMAKINSIPEIVSVRDAFEENRTAYIVMDYVPGMTLKKYIQENGTLSFEECLELLDPLIDGLDKVHRQGIIHRDISPANLMLAPHGKLYLLDLGAAKDMKKSSGNSEMVATKGYSPLEQYANSRSTGPWSDVYSMTASIYYCLFGKTPPAAVDRVENDELNFKARTKRPLTAKQIAVLKKGLAVQKEFRYQSAMELLVALREVGRKKHAAAKKIAGILGGAAVAAGLAAFLIIQKPWLPSVEQTGVEGPFMEKNLVVTEDTYKYIVDLEGSLLRITYNQEAQAYFVDSGEVIYANDPEIVDDGVTGLMASDDYLYASYFGGTDRPDYLIRMNLDGTGSEHVLELNQDHTPLQYVKLSNGREYFYTLMDSREEEDTYHLYIYRYDVKKNNLEQVIDEEVNWYSVNGKYLYYTVWDAETRTGTLKRATLSGDRVEILDEAHNYYDGFAEDGKLYLLQQTTATGDHSVGLVQVDAKGKPVEEGKGVYNVDWKNSQYAVGGGWLYYWKDGTRELRRVRLDGSGDGMILDGYAYENLSYHDGELYFQDGYSDANDTFYPTQAYIAGYDGSFAISCGMKATAFMTTQDGLQYQIEDDTVILKGYTGRNKEVILPDTIDGYPVSRNVDWNAFNYGNFSKGAVTFYVRIDPSELTYTKDEDGITITGYSGAKTGDCDNVAIPTLIDGKTVVVLGEKAFQGKTFHAVYLPEQLKVVGDETFDGCKNLQHVVYPDTLVEICNYSFYGCSMDGEEIVLPEGLTDIGMGAYYHCTPKSIYLPTTLSSVGDGFLAGCGGEYIVNPDHELICSKDGIIMSRSGGTLYAFPHDRTGTYTVPSTVTKIFDGAFYGCQLSKVIVSDSVTVIADRAFLYCTELTTIVLSRNLQEIGSRAFVNTGLTEITIPYSCKRASDSFDENLRIKYF